MFLLLPLFTLVYPSLPQVLSHVSPEIEVIDRFPEIEIVNASGRNRTNELAPSEAVDLNSEL